jgi:hypothetical protein
MKTLTKQLVIDYHKYMSQKFHFEIIQKSDCDMMPLVANALELLGIVNKDKFLRSFALTIVDPFYDQKWVYIPWTPGAGSQAALRKQVMVLAHEVEHTLQGEDIRWAPKYFTSKSYRAHMEAQAMRAELELCWYLTGKPANTKALADRLESYRVRSRDIRVTKKELDLVNMVVKRGAIGSDAGKAAIRWLKKRVR